MWGDREGRGAFVKALLSALWFTGIFHSSGAYAASSSVPSLSMMLINFSAVVPSLIQVVTAGAYALGMFFMVASLMGMKHFGEMRTMMSQEHSLSGPLVEFFVGASLLYLPSTIQMGLSTFWVSPNPYAYLDAVTDQYTVFINACYSIVQLIGLIALVRGLLILKKVGSGRSQETLGKALAHLMGGVLCINIYSTLQMLEATVGWT
jgi:intracellular multiplication protein IcmC